MPAAYVFSGTIEAAWRNLTDGSSSSSMVPTGVALLMISRRPLPSRLVVVVGAVALAILARGSTHRDTWLYS